MAPPRKMYRKKFTRKIKRLSLRGNFQEVCRRIAYRINRKVEMKMQYTEMDVSLTSNPAFYDGNMSTLNVKGLNNSFNRIGDKIHILGTQLNGCLVGADYYNMIRAGLVVLRNGGDATSTFFSDITLGSNWFSPLANDNDTGGVLHVFQDRMIGLSAPGSTNEATDLTTYATKPLKMTKYFPRGLECRFHNSTQTIKQNWLTFFLASDSLAVSHPVFKGYIQQFYIDV